MTSQTYMNSNKYQQKYKQQNIMTASPGELTLMLYDGCIKNLKLSKMHMVDNDLAKSSQMLVKAQEIISELVSSLNMSYEISSNLLSLYEFMLVKMRESNLNKDTDAIDIVVDLLTDLRNAWQEAIKINRQANFGEREKAAF